jgi:hypothetical protein
VHEADAWCPSLNFRLIAAIPPRKDVDGDATPCEVKRELRDVHVLATAVDAAERSRG